MLSWFSPPLSQNTSIIFWALCMMLNIILGCFPLIRITKSYSKNVFVSFFLCSKIMLQNWKIDLIMLFTYWLLLLVNYILKLLNMTFCNKGAYCKRPLRNNVYMVIWFWTWSRCIVRTLEKFWRWWRYHAYKRCFLWRKLFCFFNK